MSKNISYGFGAKELDDILAGSVHPGSMIIVAGHPGSGKTILASTICHANALNGHRCLYVSFQEPKEKLYRVMKNLGIDLEQLEKQNRLLFFRIPIVKDVEEIVQTISTAISSYNPGIVVIDSVNALLTYVSDIDKRAWLQNYLYQLSEVINGITVVITEVPTNLERVDLGAIEFVADVVLILKSRVERKIVSRYIEVRKARGSHIHISEIPFHIIEGKGIEILIPPTPKRISRLGRYYNIKMPVYKDIVDRIPTDGFVLIVYPCDSRTYIPTFLIADPVLENDLKILVISFTEPPHEVEYFIESIVSNLGIDIDTVKHLISRHITSIESINPYSMSSYEILMYILNSIDVHKPNVVVIHGLETLYPIIYSNTIEGFTTISNFIQALKSKGVLVIGMMSYVEEMYKVLSPLCDIVLRFFYEIANGNIENYIYVWKQNSFPKLYKIDAEAVLEALSELLKYIEGKYKLSITTA